MPTNDVVALLKARFQTNDPSVIEPLVAMGWNAETTVMVVRKATPFDDQEQKDVPLWALAAETQAWDVLAAWLNAPHPQPGAWARKVQGEFQAAWYDGRYLQARTLGQWLNTQDPQNHDARLRQALLALSETSPRSLNLMSGVARTHTRDGLEHWQALGGRLEWALESRGAGRHLLDLSQASPAVRWLYGQDIDALTVLDEQGLDWIGAVRPHIDQAFAQWANPLLSVQAPSSDPRVEGFMRDGLRLFVHLVKHAPMTDLATIGATVPELVAQCQDRPSWNGRGAEWAQTLAMACETRVLNDAIGDPAVSQPRSRL